MRTPGLDLGPFSFAGGPVGCLLIHGFTGSPPEMRPLGEYLAGHGLTVEGILLPGHGTTPEDLLRSRWQDWTSASEVALYNLLGRCRQVFVGGLSMGGLLTLYLGAHHKVDGLIPMAGAVMANNWRLWLAPVFKYFIKYLAKAGSTDLTDPEAPKRIWSYEVIPLAAAHELLRLQRETRRRLHLVTAPTLILQGMHDTAVPPRAARYIYDHIASTDKEIVWLENSGHCLTVDSERFQVFEKVHRFITRLTG
jgi:carboxylesterase